MTLRYPGMTLRSKSDASYTLNNLYKATYYWCMHEVRIFGVVTLTLDLKVK